MTISELPTKFKESNELELSDTKYHVIFTIGSESKHNINSFNYTFNDKENYPIKSLLLKSAEHKSERMSTVEEPFKGFHPETNKTIDLNLSDPKNDDLCKYLKQNAKPSSDGSGNKILYSFKKPENTILFKTLDSNYIEPLIVNSDSFEATEEEISDVGTEKDLHKAHLTQTLLGIQYIKTLNANNYINRQKIFLPPSKHSTSPDKTKTIIFDLGELEPLIYRWNFNSLNWRSWYGESRCCFTN